MYISIRVTLKSNSYGEICIDWQKEISIDKFLIDESWKNMIENKK